MQIKCVGRRSVEIEKRGDNIGLIIWWNRTRKLATLEFEKDAVIKLAQELYGCIGTDTSEK